MAGSRLARVVAALVLAALVVAPSLLYPVSQAETATSDPAAVAAESYINRIELFINRTLSIAEAYNITLPDNLTVLVDQSLELLVEARAALEEGNITLAVQLANEASSTFADVAVYVWSSLSPEQRQELRTANVEAAVEARVRVAEKLTLMLERLNKTCGCVDSEIAAQVQALVQLAERARQALMEGNVTGAERLVKRFDVQAMVTMKNTIREMKGQVEGLAAAVAAVKGAVKALNAAADYINQTIQLIEENQTQTAIYRLENVTARLLNLSVMLDKIYTVAESQGANETYLDAIETLYNATIDAASLVNASIYSLEQNDTVTAITYLSMAVETLTNATAKVSELDLPGEIREKVKVMVEAMNKLKKKLAETAGDVYAKISIWVDNLLAKLENLLAQYEQGNVPKAKVQAEFTKAKIQLENLLRVLDGKAPQELIQKIQDAINWIEANMPQDQGGMPGGGHSRP